MSSIDTRSDELPLRNVVIPEDRAAAALWSDDGLAAARGIAGAILASAVVWVCLAVWLLI